MIQHNHCSHENSRPHAPIELGGCFHSACRLLYAYRMLIDLFDAQVIAIEAQHDAVAFLNLAGQ
ncbi:hypothetical protein Heshes_05780 [Alicyclobacillus hesperidum]|uniref:Uncharacterized protein n=1 Tax=Alicyclobacillus hesperidum TaxID=89784 RepID=A0AA37X6F5_9BACL|nr:hypothetical protein Heshes_05780 [Alicyclobacillus hesperidum]